MNLLFAHAPSRVVVAIIIAAVVAPFAFIVASASPAHAADESAINSTQGTDFWISFERNISFSATLSVTGAVDTSGTVEWPDGTSDSFTVTANAITNVSVPASVVTALGALPDDGVSADIGIHITALDDVTIYGLNYHSTTSDAFVALPTGSLGTRYRALSSDTTIASYPSRLMVLATQDATTVTVTPQETLGVRTVGVPYNVELNAGEVYVLAERTKGADITGTLVEADRPVAVYGTVDCANVGGGACDTLTQQMFPTDSWGVKFIAPRFPAVTAATPVRVLADEDDTEVSVDGAVVATLAAGEFWEGSIATSGDGNNAALIETSKPVEVGTYMVGGDSYGSTGQTGDPAFLLLSPYEQYLASYTVGTPGTGFNFNGITVVVPTSSTGTFEYNGSTVASGEWAAVAGTTFSTAQLEVAPGTYTLTADQPFGAYVYGANSYNSYAYAGGTALSAVATVASMSLRTDASLTAPVTTEVCIAVSVVDGDGNPVPGVRVDGTVSGANAGVTMTAATIATGSALLCYVGSNEGEDTVAITAGVASSTTTVTWTPYADEAPLVVLDPEDATITEGASAYFEGVTSGAPTPTLQWEISTDGGTTWSEISGETHRTLVVVGSTADDGNQYRVVATNSESIVTSSPATLTVLPTPVAPTVTDPADVTVGDGDTATFTVTTTGVPDATVTWQISTDGGSTWSSLSGSTGESYTTPATTLSDDGNQYRALAANSAGGAFSAAAILTVVELPHVTDPADQVVSEGDTATFTVTASGAPTPTVQWQVSTDGGGTWSDIVGATRSSYTTAAAALADSGSQYRVAATNSNGTRYSAGATLTVVVAPTVTDPADQVVSEGDTATFTVTASGAPTPTVQWQVSTDGGGMWSDIVGATSSSYTTAAAALADSGSQYRVAATNSQGTDYSAGATLTVVAAPTVTDPADQVVSEGDTATFTVTASGAPTPTVQWQVSTDGGGTWSDIVGATRSSYTTAAAALADSGSQYRVAATNSQGTDYSAGATLTVVAAPTVTDPADQVVSEGDTATFTVTASGAPTPTVQWQVSTDGGGTWSDIAGETSPSYTTGVLATADDGNKYRAVVTNTSGTEFSAVATVSVTAAAVEDSDLASTGVQSGVGLVTLLGGAGLLGLAGVGLIMFTWYRRRESR